MALFAELVQMLLTEFVGSYEGRLQSSKIMFKCYRCRMWTRYAISNCMCTYLSVNESWELVSIFLCFVSPEIHFCWIEFLFSGTGGGRNEEEEGTESCSEKRVCFKVQERVLKEATLAAYEQKIYPPKNECRANYF